MPSKRVLGAERLPARLVDDVERFDEGAFAEVVLQKLRLAAVTVLRQHDVLARVDKLPRRVQTNEAEATRDQDHVVRSLRISRII